ncbi:MAG: EamA family transporter [Actinomycetaceae bacterium]|nr:EamA family transporter [Actinomycetaceae bacterium]
MIRTLINRIPAPILFIISGLTQYSGAALAVILFTVMTPTTVAWWRVSIAAVILLLWRRPWTIPISRRDIAWSALFGIFMTGMNIVFYEAVSRIDLGVAVSLEFLGPVLVAVTTNRTFSARLAAGFAFIGVALISGLGLDTSQPRIGQGILLAILAGLLWGAYMVLGQRIASRRSGLTSLAIGSTAGAIVFSPLAFHDAGLAFATIPIIVTVIGVSVLSTVLPYSIDQIAFARLDASTFALLNSLLPATSLIIGAIALHQLPSIPSVIGLILISIAVWLASFRTKPRPSRAAQA